MHQLSGHHGCVNSLGWSQEGVLLASGSDDTKICVWNPLDKAKTLVSKIVSGHRANIFQSKFLPNSSSMKIVTTGRDGEVRLAQLDETGQVWFGKLLKILKVQKKEKFRYAIFESSSKLFLFPPVLRVRLVFWPNMIKPRTN